MDTSLFGKLLRVFRQRSDLLDQSGRWLSQEKLGELLASELGMVGFSGVAVSDWERGKSKIRADDRRVLVALLKILQSHNSIVTLSEANQLLEAGDYRPLSDEEINRVNIQWLSSINEKEIIKPPHDERHPNAATLNFSRSFLGHTYHINTLSIYDHFLASGGGDTKAIIWDFKSGQQIFTGRHDSWVGSVILTKDYLLASTGKGQLLHWNYHQDNSSFTRSKNSFFWGQRC